ncbi:MAG: ABC transporter permease subunit, partial [Actinomycetota bacterium]
MTIALRLLKDRRRSLVWWSAGVLSYLLLQLSFYPALREQPALDDALENLPEGIQKLFGAGDLPLTSPAGYLHSQVFTTALPIVLLVFGIALGARAIAGSEDDGTLELLLANPVSRARVAVERYAGMAALILLLGALTTVG